MPDDLSEFETRRVKIDVMLKKSGWNVSSNDQVLVEIDTKQSDFNRRIFKTFTVTFHDRSISEKEYADYLLLDHTRSPLAVIEAKRTSKDPISGQKQAESYADDIKEQTGKDVFIFLSNGDEIWFLSSDHSWSEKGLHQKQ